MFHLIRLAPESSVRQWSGNWGRRENQQTPRSQAKSEIQFLCRRFLLFPGWVIRYRTGAGWEYESTSTPTPHPHHHHHRHIPGAQRPLHKHLRFYSTQAFSVLTLHLRKKLQTPPSRGPDLFTSQWPLQLHSPLPAPHSSLLLVLVQSGCPRPAGRPQVAQGSRSSPARVGRRRLAAGARLSAGPRTSASTGAPDTQSRHPKPWRRRREARPLQGSGNSARSARVLGASKAPGAPPRPPAVLRCLFPRSP